MPRDVTNFGIGTQGDRNGRALPVRWQAGEGCLSAKAGCSPGDGQPCGSLLDHVPGGLLLDDSARRFSSADDRLIAASLRAARYGQVRGDLAQFGVGRGMKHGIDMKRLAAELDRNPPALAHLSV